VSRHPGNSLAPIAKGMAFELGLSQRREGAGFGVQKNQIEGCVNAL